MAGLIRCVDLYLHGFVLLTHPSSQVNFVNNYYKPGPNSTRHYTLMAQFEDGLPGSQTYYCEGNSMLGYFNQTATQVDENPSDTSNPTIPCWPKITIDPAPAYQKFYDVPYVHLSSGESSYRQDFSFYDSFVETHTSTEAYKVSTLSCETNSCKRPSSEYFPTQAHRHPSWTTTIKGSSSRR